MTYKIRQYNESYIEKQVEIGTFFDRKWLAYGQSNVEQVKARYAREDFDPETRLYCFKDDEMVGFIGANINDIEEENIKRATSRLAFVLPGHEQAFDLLYNELIKVLKAKGVAEIDTPQTKLNDDYYERAEKLGFSPVRTVTKILVATPETYIPYETENGVLDYNHENDAEDVKKQLNEAYPNFTGEALDNYINGMPDNPNLLTYKIIKKDDKLVGCYAAVKTQTEKTASIQLLLGKSREYKKHLISEGVKTINKKGFEKVAVFLNPENPVDKEEIDDFKAVGFEVAGTYDILRKKL